MKLCRPLCSTETMHCKILKASFARWSPNTNTVHNYGELGIFLWDVFRNPGLPIVRKMYDKFSPAIVLLRKSSSYSLMLSFQRWEGLSEGDKRHKYIVG